MSYANSYHISFIVHDEAGSCTNNLNHLQDPSRKYFDQ